VVIVSYRANRIKSDASATELLKVAKFYAQLASNKRRQNNMPGVQLEEKEEK